MRSGFIIRHPSQLFTLSVFPGLRTPGRGKISLQDEQLDPETRLAWEQQLNHHYFACGCDKAALGLAFAVVLYPAWLLMQRDGWTNLSWGNLWTGLALVFIATLLGKVTGLWMAQQKLNNLVKEIQSKWKVPEVPEPPQFGCG